MKDIGIKYFYTSSKPLGGIIKKVPEDFVVEEIDKHGKLWKVKYPFYSRILDLIPRRRKEYLHLTLVKRNLDTIRAVQLISKSLGISRKRIKFAGNKDKRAVTSQRISIFNVSIKEVRKVKVKGIKLKDFRYSSEEIKIGDLWGNRFTVRITDIPFEKEVIRERVEEFKREIANGIANFFGIQRFGEKRTINHLIGKRIILGDFEGALKILLSEVSEKESERSREARTYLMENWRDWKGALRIFPKWLYIERSVLDHLAKYPNDLIGALRKIPKGIRLIFVNAYQSYIFNLTLSELIRRGFRRNVKVPLVGYETKLEGEIGEIITEVLREEGVSLEDFIVRSMPEMSSKGSQRDYLFYPKDFRILKLKDHEIVIQFILRKSCYATVLLNELMKNI